MGTRNLLVIKHDGKVKVANYNQWDGYPSGQGLAVLKYVRGEDEQRTDYKGNPLPHYPCVKFDRDALIAGLAHVYEPTEDQMTEFFESVGVKVGPDGDAWLNLDQSDAYTKKYPSLSRDTGWSLLHLIQSAVGPLPVRNSIEFGKDGLMCEYVWVVDLDENSLTMYHNYPGMPIASCSLLLPPTLEFFIEQFEAADKEEEEES